MCAFWARLRLDEAERTRRALTELDGIARRGFHPHVLGVPNPPWLKPLHWPAEEGLVGRQMSIYTQATWMTGRDPVTGGREEERKWSVGFTSSLE